jgi:DNA-binding SARP family transcriptional activator
MSVPSQVRDQDPWAHYWLARSQQAKRPADTGEFEKAFELFQKAGDFEGVFLSWAGGVEALCDGERLIELDPWLARLNDLHSRDIVPPSDECRDSVALAMFRALLKRQPQHPDLELWAERARAVLGRPIELTRKFRTARNFIWHSHWFTRPAQAKLIVDGLRSEIASLSLTPQLEFEWYRIQALQQLTQGSFEGCLKSVARASALAERHEIEDGIAELRLVAAHAEIALGRLERAEERLRDASMLLSSQSARWAGQYHLLSAWQAFQTNNYHVATEHVLEAERLFGAAGDLFHESLCRVGLALIYFEMGEHERAAHLLSEAQKGAHVNGSPQLSCIGRMADGYFALQHGHSNDATMLLANAFSIARRHGYASLFWWHPRIMAQLCAKALESSTEVNYTRRLVRTRKLTREAPPVDVEYWPWPVKIYALGRFSVLHDNKPLHFGRKAQHKPIEMLKVLIAFGARGVSAERITAALWPNTEGDTAQRAFDTTLHRLRKLLGEPQALQLQDRKLTLSDHHCWVDLWSFERMLGRIEKLTHSGKSLPPDDLDVLARQALALYKGHFLASESLQSWSISLRERLRSKYLRQLHAVGRYWEEHGRWETAAQYYLNGLEVDDLAEQFYQRLMLCYEQLGRRSEALAVYRRCRTTLSLVLAINPSSQTEAIRRRVMKA